MVWGSHKLNTSPVFPPICKGHQSDNPVLCVSAMPSKSLGAVAQNRPLHSALWTKLTTVTESSLLGYSQVTKPRLGEAKTYALMCHTTSPSSLESAHPTLRHQGQRSIIPQNPFWVSCRGPFSPNHLQLSTYPWLQLLQIPPPSPHFLPAVQAVPPPAWAPAPKVRPRHSPVTPHIEAHVTPCKPMGCPTPTSNGSK